MILLRQLDGTVKMDEEVDVKAGWFVYYLIVYLHKTSLDDAVSKKLANRRGIVERCRVVKTFDLFIIVARTQLRWKRYHRIRF